MTRPSEVLANVLPPAARAGIANFSAGVSGHTGRALAAAAGVALPVFIVGKTVDAVGGELVRGTAGSAAFTGVLGAVLTVLAAGCAATTVGAYIASEGAKVRAAAIGPNVRPMAGAPTPV